MAKKQRVRPTVARLRELFHYNPETGILTGKSGYRTGKVMGNKEPNGYLQLMVEGWRGRVHQVAYAMHYGEWAPDVIDHINGIKSDNRIANIRSVTYAGNSANRKKSGFSTIRGKIRAQIMSKGERVHLGVYESEQHAIYVTAFADLMLNGQHAHRDSRVLVMQVLQESLA